MRDKYKRIHGVEISVEKLEGILSTTETTLNAFLALADSRLFSITFSFLNTLV